MSVFGGDSWGREAQYRKRRVNDLLLESSAAADEKSYRKLPSGKYACLVCPHNPVLDTPLILSMHLKAKRHIEAELRAKQREEERQNEMNKRIALSVDSTFFRKTDGKLNKRTNLDSKPLIEKTRKAVFEVLHNSYSEESTSYCSQATHLASDLTFGQGEVSGKDVVQQMPLDYRERKERELKFTAAGWKRDCNGGWFRDENVEFDSDEEDPNLALANGQ